MSAHNLKTLNLRWKTSQASYLPQRWGLVWVRRCSLICGSQLEKECVLGFCCNYRFSGVKGGKPQDVFIFTQTRPASKPQDPRLNWQTYLSGRPAGTARLWLWRSQGLSAGPAPTGRLSFSRLVYRSLTWLWWLPLRLSWLVFGVKAVDCGFARIETYVEDVVVEGICTCLRCARWLQ